MATFVSTIKFTPQGIAAVSETTKRAVAFKAAAKKLGVKVVATYWTLGKYDGFILFEAPDEESATAAMLQLSLAGNVSTATTRAYTAAEMDQVLAKLQ